MIPHSRPWITSDDVAAVSARLREGMIAGGTLRGEFERQSAAYTGYQNAVATASGTAAQVLILRALGIGPRDQVALPTYVCRSVYDAVLQVGAEPVLCDVSGHWHMTPDDLRRAKAVRLKAIVLVHTFGIDASHPHFEDFGVPVIDDLCQAFGLPVGRSSSRLAFCSLQATKCLTTGEGGLALCDDAGIAARLASFRDRHEPLTRFSDLQAALGVSQLARYGDFVRRRKELARAYMSRLPEQFIAEMREVSSRSIFYRFALRLNASPDTLIARFAARGIAVRKGVDQLIHRLVGAPDGPFASAVARFDTTLSIPIYPALEPWEFEQIITSIEELLGT
jgi:perosamine synthetase